jgi:DNA-binding PucR family transcriptional regulator
MHQTDRPWPKPSERVRELIRAGAERALRAPPEWLDEIDAATLSSEHMQAVAGDPVLAAATRRTNRSNLAHWAAANIRDPGAPVPPNLSPEALGVSRDLVRRGVAESALHSYRTGQNAAWLRWMTIAFELTSDPAELRELLDVSARSISAFIDGTIAAIAEQMNAERDELTRGTHAERREVVALVLDGAPIAPASASHRLGYDLEQAHRAAVVWSDAAESDLGALERGAEAVASALGDRRPLVVMASAATLWIWAPVAGEIDPERRGRLRVTLERLGDVRVALGTRGSGVDGFRRSHFDAVTTQRMLARVGSDARITSFDEVRLVSVVTQAPDQARELVAYTLGDLATAAPELRDALRTFLAEGCNASRAADVLHTHRNTLLRRLARAEELLPRPLDGSRIDVAVALEVLRWQRPDPGRGQPPSL